MCLALLLGLRHLFFLTEKYVAIAYAEVNKTYFLMEMFRFVLSYDNYML